MENQKPTETDINFFKKHIQGFIPTSVCALILYLSIQIMTQLTSLQKQISQLRASIITRQTIHQISRHECQKFYRDIKGEIQNSAVQKILEFHKNDHK